MGYDSIKFLDLALLHTSNTDGFCLFAAKEGWKNGFRDLSSRVPNRAWGVESSFIRALRSGPDGDVTIGQGNCFLEIAPMALASSGFSWLWAGFSFAFVTIADFDLTPLWNIKYPSVEVCLRSGWPNGASPNTLPQPKTKRSGSTSRSSTSIA